MTEAQQAGQGPTPTPTPAPARTGEMPQYELTETAYINDQLKQPGETVYTRGIPGPHMIPVNEAAKAMCAKHSREMQAVDPIHSLTLVGPGAEVLTPVHNRG